MHVHSNTTNLPMLLLVPGVTPPHYATWIYHLQLFLDWDNLYYVPFNLVVLDSHSLAAAA